MSECLIPPKEDRKSYTDGKDQKKTDKSFHESKSHMTKQAFVHYHLAKADEDSFRAAENKWIDDFFGRAKLPYTESEFWAILDKFYNRDLFEKNEYGEWQLKHPIWEENK